MTEMPPRLRVMAGPTAEDLVCISSLVNTNLPHRITSDYFDGELIANIKGFTDASGMVVESEYFKRNDRQGITWSIQVQGRFLVPYSADDIMFGNTFERPLNLPWGSGAALKFMHYVDPTLTHDLTSSTKPWALSPLISTMPHLAHTRITSLGSPTRSSSSSSTSLSSDSSELGVGGPCPPSFPSRKSLQDETSQLHLAKLTLSPASSDSSAISSKSTSSKSLSLLRVKKEKRNPEPGLGLKTASDRRSYFSKTSNRQEIVLGPKDVLTMDFCYGFLEFNPRLSLRLPGGISFDLMRYWDGQPVRFVCCERKDSTDQSDGNPWGRVLWCVVVESADEDEDGSVD